MPIMSYSVLNISLIEVQMPQPNYNVLSFDYFTNLYTTGCRPLELLNNSLWSLLDDGNYMLQPLKNNLPRYIDTTQLTFYFRKSLQADNPLYAPLTYRRLRDRFNQFYQFYKPTVGNKDVELYLFRYRYVRGLKLAGLTDAEIVDMMGWTSSSVLNGYLDNDINY